MKTLYQILQEMNSESLVNSLMGYEINSPLWSFDKTATIAQIEREQREKIVRFIETLKSLKPKAPEEGREGIIFARRVLDFIEELVPALVYTDDLKEDGLDCTVYSLTLSAWEEALGYKVADIGLCKHEYEPFIKSVLRSLAHYGYERTGLDAYLEYQAAIAKDYGTDPDERFKTIAAHYAVVEAQYVHFMETASDPDDERELKEKVIEAESEYLSYTLKKILWDVIQELYADGTLKSDEVCGGRKERENKKTTEENKIHPYSPLGKIGLKKATVHCLYRAGIYRVGDLVKLTESDLLRVRTLGKKKLEEIKETLDSLGFSLAG